MLSALSQSDLTKLLATLENNSDAAKLITLLVNSNSKSNSTLHPASERGVNIQSPLNVLKGPSSRVIRIVFGALR